METGLALDALRQLGGLTLDPLFLSRLQFAFTVAFHILFPTFTIGLASFLCVVEGLALKTGKPVYWQLFDFWSKIFALGFATGIVSGVVLSYQFGTNWGPFTIAVANVLGPLLGFEVLTAFFLEAGFVGVMLFGRHKVGPRLHFVATCCVAFGTMLSAFWILSANSWMQTPAGAVLGPDGRFLATDWLAVIFNPSFAYRFVHMILATFLSGAMVVMGISAFYLLRGTHSEFARTGLRWGLAMAVITAPLQIVAGDLHGLNTFEHQPMKVAAMEGVWQTQAGADLLLFAIPDQEQQRNHAAIAIPDGASWILTHDTQGVVPGLNEVPRADQPPVAVVFYAFRIMVGCGVAMLLLALWGGLLFARRRLDGARWFQRACVAGIPLGFIATLAGWTVTEVGRQPWTVQGFLRTADGVSPISGAEVSLSLVLFLIVYGTILVALLAYMGKLVLRGPGQPLPPVAVRPGRESAIAAE